MGPLPRHRPRRAVLGYACTAVTVMACAALLGAAALVPAPPAVLPLVALVCIGCPMLAVWELARWKMRTRGGGLHADAIDDLRRVLDQLPETRHPLGY